MKAFITGLVIVALIVLPPIVAELLTANPIFCTITIVLSLIGLGWFTSNLLQTLAENE